MRPRVTEEEYRLLETLRANKELADNVKNHSIIQEIETEVILERQLNELLPDALDVENYYFDLNGYRGRKFIIISDVHLPYQDNNAVKAMLKYAVSVKPDGFIMNGDIFDNGELSTHLDLKRRYTFKKELDTTKEFFHMMRTLFPTAELIYKSGNHEEKRLNRKIASEAREFRDLDCLKLESLLELNNYGIKYVRENQIMKFGELAILHGHEIGGNTAKAKLAKAQSNIIFGHHHKTDYERCNTLLGKSLEAHMLGCLCNLRPGYAPFNNWNHGFIVSEFGYNLDYVIQVKKIDQNYKIV